MPSERTAPSSPQSDKARQIPAGLVQSRMNWPQVVLAVLAILAALYVARDVLVPIAFAVLLALLLRPFLRRMQRLHMPDLLSAFILVALVASLVAVGTYMLAGQAQRWLAEAPQTIQRVSQMVPKGPGTLANLQKTTQAVEELTQSQKTDQPVVVVVQSSDIVHTLLGVSGHVVGAAVIVFVVAYFLLAFSGTLLRQAIGARPKFIDKRNIIELVQNIENGISRYLLTITTINIGLGIVTALAMWVLGIPNPILWGVMAATLNYVPHVGAFLCTVVLFFVGAVSHESLAYGCLTAGVFVVLTSVESYLVIPMALSKSLHLSPLAVILAILLCGWMWGIAGGLMAAPLLAIVKIVCDQFDSLKIWAALLAGNTIDAKAADRTAPAAAGTGSQQPA